MYNILDAIKREEGLFKGTIRFETAIFLFCTYTSLNQLPKAIFLFRGAKKYYLVVETRYKIKIILWIRKILKQINF